LQYQRIAFSAESAGQMKNEDRNIFSLRAMEMLRYAQHDSRSGERVL